MENLETPEISAQEYQLVAQAKYALDKQTFLSKVLIGTVFTLLPLALLCWLFASNPIASAFAVIIPIAFVVVFLLKVDAQAQVERHIKTLTEAGVFDKFQD